MEKIYTKTSIIILSAFVLSYFSACNYLNKGNNKKVKIIVTAKAINDTNRVYICGNNELLGNWKPGAVQLTKINDSTWSKDFIFAENTLVKFKFSKGSLRTEAVEKEGIQHYNVHFLNVKNDTVLQFRVEKWMDCEDAVVNIKPEYIKQNNSIRINNGWKYHKGDNYAWAEKDINDNDWDVAYTLMYKGDYPETGWDGLGWFRLHVDIDSSLLNKPLSFAIAQAGASEVYLNGRLFYKYGVVGNSAKTEYLFDDRNPKVIVFTELRNVLAIRYSSFSLRHYNYKNVSDGFLIGFGSLNEQITQRIEYTRNSSITQMIFSSIAVAFALMHFFLFLFYSKFRENLYYAICMLGFALITFADYQTTFTRDVDEIILFIHIANIAKYLAIVFGILMVYSMSFGKIPRYAAFFVISGILLSVWTVVQPFDVGNKIGDIFLVIAMVEMLRSSLMRKTKHDRGWVVFAGFLILCISVAYQLLVAYEIINPLFAFRATYLYGALALSISMSIFLSQRFARINKDLAFQLVQVRELSEQAIKHERLVKEQEIQQRLLEADNQRKTKELEEARQLQLSMLPKNIPAPGYLKIAAYMKTANEVGGDYYDFYLENENKLTAVIGDATGHGLRAGTMVTAAKSLFNEFAHYDDIKFIFEKFTKSFKLLNFEKLYMAMLMIKIEDYKLTTASAGMPTPLIYRANTKAIEELPVKGMPLGCFDDFPYSTIETELNAGDTILLMSDGFPELFNENNEELEFENVKIFFEKYSSLEPDDIIKKLLEEGEKWAGSRPQDDDITFVVIKVV